jgi:hypothetical protein
MLSMGNARVELRLGIVDALPHMRSRPIVYASTSAAPGSGFGGGLELRGVGR